MSVQVHQHWTHEQFFDWASAQDIRYEFDGFQPVAMTSGSANHSRITLNLHGALDKRLRGTGCSSFGPDLGISTIGDTIRYPDALVTCTNFPGTARIAPDPVVVFEVVSPSSAHIDGVVKLREYQAVASIRRYVMLESVGVGLTVFEKQTNEDWKDAALAAGGTLAILELGIAIPLSEFYQNVEFTEAPE